MILQEMDSRLDCLYFEELSTHSLVSTTDALCYTVSVVTRPQFHSGLSVVIFQRVVTQP